VFVSSVVAWYVFTILIFFDSIVAKFVFKSQIAVTSRALGISMACTVTVGNWRSKIANTCVVYTVTVFIGVHVCSIVAWLFDFSSVSEAESRAEEDY
jgi:hypothetical protein